MSNRLESVGISETTGYMRSLSTLLLKDQFANIQIQFWGYETKHLGQSVVVHRIVFCL